MKLTKEQLVIIALSLAFVAMSCMYFQSLITIERMYTSSAIESLETDFGGSAFAVLNQTATTTASPNSIVETDENTPVAPVITPPLPAVEDKACYRGGCSGQLCGDKSIQDIATTCEWREEYACYAEPIGICERQLDGQCGWTQTEELNSCLIKGTGPTQTQTESLPEVEII